ncbi:MAG TPA: alpha/beta hydrolase [Nocardioidaceae bacterium]
MTTSLAQSRIDVLGLTTTLLAAGDQASTEAVVFVHGNPGPARDWTDLVESVGEFARAVAWDFPGYGSADKPADFDYTIEGYARFLDAALDRLGIQRVHLVMHDFGGGWGLRWAVDHPERFASAVLVNTGVLPGYRWHWAAQIWRTPVLGEMFMATTTRPALHLVLKQGNPRGLPKEYVDRMYDDYDTATRKAVLKLYRATTADAMGALVDPLRALDRPALIVWGAKDPYVPVSYADRQREAFPSAEIHLLEDSGHWPMVDNPDRVREIVVPFLRRVVGG